MGEKNVFCNLTSDKGLQEMNVLCALLGANGIECSVDTYLGGPHLIVKKDGRNIVSVICHYGSYGFQKGLLEAWDWNPEKDPEGYLTAEEAFRYIEKRLKGESE